MILGLAPVKRRRVFDRRIVAARKPPTHAQFAARDERRLQADADRVGVRITTGDHGDGFSVEVKSTGDYAGPEIERLLGVDDVVRRKPGPVRFYPIECDLAERMQAGIAPQPTAGLGALQTGQRKSGAVSLHEVTGRVGQRVSIGVFLLNPTPASEGFEGDALSVIEIPKRLQSGHIDREGKASVAHGKGRPRIDRTDDWIVSGDKGVTIDGDGRSAVAVFGVGGTATEAGNDQQGNGATHDGSSGSGGVAKAGDVAHGKVRRIAHRPHGLTFGRTQHDVAQTGGRGVLQVYGMAGVGSGGAQVEVA